jgi:hypothetical protein
MASLAPQLTQTAFMSQNPAQDSNGADLVRKSSLYLEFQAEKEEILKHKWIESQKAGHDIGFERALTDWIIKHRSKWRRSRQPSQAQAGP